MKCKIFLFLTATTIFATASSPARAVEQWSFTPLPYLPQGSMSIPLTINNGGQIIGTSYGSTQRTFIYEGGYINELPNQLPIGLYTKSINDNGQIAGFGYPDGFNNRTKAVIWSDAGIQNLGALVSGGASTATDINNNGQIVGFSENNYYTQNTRAVVWNDSKISNLGVLYGGNNSYANAINDAGLVVGYSSGGLISGNRATLWQNGEIIDLTFGSGSDSEAIDINSIGQIVGTINGRATLWFQGSTIDLGTLEGHMHSVAKSINSDGWAVGYSDGASNVSGDERATLWRNGNATDLNSLDAVLASGWKLYSATQINDSGQIIGMGINPNGNFYQGFLLSPVPEPATFSFMLLGLLSIFCTTIKSGRVKTKNRTPQQMHAHTI